MKVSKVLLAAIALACSTLLLASCATPTSNTDNDKSAIETNSQNVSSNTSSNANTPTSFSDVSVSSASVTQGTYYRRYDLTDTQIGVPVFSAFLPDGWAANIASDWSVISIGAPGLEEIVITSPDGMATITIDSCQAYTQSPYGDEGQSFEYYTTYMNYKNAGQFVDAYMSMMYPEATLIQDLGSNPDVLNQLHQYNELLSYIGTQEASAMTNGGQIGNVESVTTPTEETMCRRQYQVNDGYLEASCTDVLSTQSISSPYLSETYQHWRIPYSIVYRAANKQVFDEYYDEYEMIVANSYFTPQYYSAESYVSQQITAVAMDAKAAAAGYSASGYVDENAMSTNDKVMGMWDDYINEVDSYNTLDGGTVKTSMYNDVVAQSGDQYFIGSATSDIPSGFTELSKSY